MTETFAPLPIPTVAPSPLLREAEATRWRSVSTICRHTLGASVTGVSFSPADPYDVAASSDFSVSLVGSRAGTVRRSLARFKFPAYSPHYKPDGRLLVAGEGGGGALVFDLGSRAVLRKFLGHKGAVRTARFSADGLRVMTGSDDSTVRAWDLATGQSLLRLSDATDYVRAQNSSPASQHVWMAGSLDRKARLYDLRTSRCIFTLDHGSQVDDVHILPGGTRAITIGGPEARVWDFFAAGKMITKFACHAKAITSGAVDYEGHTFATAGLDGYVKVHDLSTFRTKGMMSFGSEIMSLDVSKDGVKYAVGMANGCLELRSLKSSRKHLSSVAQSTDRREREFEGWGRGFEKVDTEALGPKPGGPRYFSRGQRAEPSDDHDFIVPKITKLKLAPYDKCLRRFAHGEALDEAIKMKRPIILTSVVEELIMRGALKGALAGRDQDALCPILHAILRSIRKPRYARRMGQLLNAILDLYGADFGEHEEADKLLARILTAVKREVQACHDLSALHGAAEALLCASSVHS